LRRLTEKSLSPCKIASLMKTCSSYYMQMNNMLMSSCKRNTITRPRAKRHLTLKLPSWTKLGKTRIIFKMEKCSAKFFNLLKKSMKNSKRMINSNRFISTISAGTNKNNKSCTKNY